MFLNLGRRILQEVADYTKHAQYDSLGLIMIQQPSSPVTRKRDEVSKQLLIINLAPAHDFMLTIRSPLSTSCDFVAQVQEHGRPRRSRTFSIPALSHETLLTTP